MDTMCMRCGHDIGASLVDFGMNEEPSFINRQLGSPFHDKSISIQKDKIRSLDSREVLGEWVHPEVVLENRVCNYVKINVPKSSIYAAQSKNVIHTSHRDMPGNTLPIAKFTEVPESCCHVLSHPLTLLVQV